MIISVPITNTSSIVVLEGDYTNTARSIINADSITKLLLDNGYKINLDNICIGTQSQHEGIILTKSEEK